jgi:ABC-type transporter Mla MlaB component
MQIMWLSGALDQATVTLLDHELDRRAIGMMHLVVDLTGLEVIDSAGLDALIGIDWRASERDDQLSFRHVTRVAQAPVELTPSVRRRSRWAAHTTGISDQDFYFALALACVEVGHLPPGDRPGPA